MEDITVKAFSDDGLLCLPKLHDAMLTGVTVRNESVMFTFSTRPSATEIIISGLERLLVQEFREGNIVLEAGLARESEHVRLVLLALLQCKEHQHLSYREAVLKKVIDGEQILFYSSSSYGASIMALAKSIQVLSE